MSLQYIVQQKKIFAKHRQDTFEYNYDDYVDAERCYNRVIRQTLKESERYYTCEIVLKDRTSQRLFKEIKPTR